ncbi:protein lethal(2)denticleless [Vanessa atalanta]|uniref:protein lethal(2)denticleless n=1 Tax=Vanessa atalanta TaxID=42275 RepID=UPI001FCD932B|nr:protein lethal(2)denticleless [Vanessa atalanta]
MNDVQNIIDRQLGIYSRFNYDNVLKRLSVQNEESFYGLQTASSAANFDQDPPIFACRFSEAPGYEHILALANEDGRVAIQDTRTQKTASTLEGFQCHNNAVFDLAWMPQNMKFVTVSGDHTACLWDVAEAAPRRVLVFSNHTRSVKTAAFRPTEPSVFATGARDGRVLVWDARAAAPALVLRPDVCLAGCHAFAPRASPRARRPRADPRRALSITGLAFRDDLTLVSCGECDGNIKVWDMRKNYGVYKREPLPKHSIPYCGSSARNGYTNLIIDDARVRLYASCMDDVIYCFNVSTFGSLPEQRYVGHENSTFYIKTGLSPDGAYLVSGSSDKNAYVWNVKYSQPVVRLSGHRAEVTCAAWCQRGDTKIVTCSDDARHKIWRVGPEAPADEAAGRAELTPRADGGPQWGARDRTPHALRRRGASPASPAPPAPPAKRARAGPKRCLAELLGARDADAADAKRPRIEAAPDGDARKRPAAPEPEPEPEPVKRRRSEPERDADDWPYFAAKAGTSFVTPPRSYERKGGKVLSPRSPPSPRPPARSPDGDSRGAVKIITFTTPTKNLPNFVLNGEAPHLRLMSPVKKKPETTDWLTLMVRERRGKTSEPNERLNVAAPSSPKENVPARRNSVTDRITKSNNKNRTLLKYFSVAKKEK